MKKLTLLALLTTTSLGFAATAHADFVTIGGSTLNLTANGAAISSISGNLVPPGNVLDDPVSLYQGPGSLNNTLNPGPNGPFGGNGISLIVNNGPDKGAIIDITPLGSGQYQIKDLQNGKTDTVQSIGITITPEPSQVISMLALAGMGGAALLVKRRRRKQA